MLHTKFRENRPAGSGEEEQIMMGWDPRCYISRGGCQQRIEVFVKIQKKNFFWGGGCGGGGGVRGGGGGGGGGWVRGFGGRCRLVPGGGGGGEGGQGGCE